MNSVNPQCRTEIVKRDHYLQTIDGLFSNKVFVVYLEGIDGIGKTTLANEFCRMKKGFVVPLFLAAPTKYGYDPALTRARLISNADGVLTGEASIPDEGDLEPEWQHTIQRLQRHALRTGEKVYFVVDGLDLIESSNVDMIQTILDLIPIGVDSFRVLISRNEESCKIPNEKSIGNATFTVPFFSVQDTKEFFAAHQCTDQEIERIHKICNGLPAKCSSIRRCLVNGDKLSVVLENENPVIDDFFQMEWTHTDKANSLQFSVLCLLAHIQNPFPVSLLKRFLNCSTTEIQTSVERLGFISSDDNKLEFADNAFLRFAEKKLATEKRGTLNLVIDNLLSSPNDELAFTQLPVLMESVGRTDELFGLLNPDFFSGALDRLRSVVPLKKSADLALSAAKKNNDDKLLVQFAMNKCVFEQLNAAEIWRSEVKANLSLGEFENASWLANSVELKEAKFELLSLVANYQRQAGTVVNQELLAQIKRSFADVDLAGLGDRKKGIAQDLAFVCPEIAGQLFESMDSKDADLTIVNTLIDASLKDEFKRENLKDPSFEYLKSQISNPKLQELGAIVPGAFGTENADQIISDVGEIGNLDFSLFILKSWIRSNRELGQPCLKVATYAFKRIIGSTVYTPNAGDIRTFAELLPIHAKENKVKRLITDISKMDESLRKNGPSYDYVRLGLLVAETHLLNADFALAENEVSSVSLFISDLKDQNTKAECLGSLFSFYKSAKDATKLANHSERLKQTGDLLNASFIELVDSTASHFKVCAKSIRVLARSDLSMAMRFAEKLNTEYRRDLAKSEVVDSNFSATKSDANFESLHQVIRGIEDTVIRGITIRKLWKRISHDRNNHSKYNVEKLKPHVQLISQIEDAEDRATAYCYSIEFLVRNSPNSDTKSTEVEKLQALVEESCEVIDVVWVRLRSYFSCATLLSKIVPDKAKGFLEKATKLKSEAYIHTGQTASAASAAIRLSVSAYSSLFARRKDTAEDLERISNVIEILPSKGERVLHWADVAQRFIIANRKDDAAKIVNEKMLGEWESISPKEKQYKEHVLVETIQVLYETNPVTALERIQKLPPNKQDDAFSKLVNFTFRKEPLFEPYERVSGASFKISYDEATKICKLLNHVERDSLIASTAYGLVDSALANGNKFTREHKRDVADRLEEIAKTKFKSKRFLQHDGYRLIIRMLCLKLRNGNAENWESLIDDARKIQNISDQVLILTEILNAIPNRFKPLRESALAPVESDAFQIPAPYDRVGRLKGLAENVHSFDKKREMTS